jgi:hypothetical protein
MRRKWTSNVQCDWEIVQGNNLISRNVINLLIHETYN